MTLAVENVSHGYRTRHGKHQVLENVSFALARGRNLGILGRNGSGKSTLIRLLSGAERPDVGVIRRGMTVSWPLAFAGAFQPHLTALDNVKFICRVYGVDYRTRVTFVRDFAELGGFFREPVLHYSHGMLTRLAFALSMAIEFDCFLIDEAMVVGDIRFHERCHHELFRKRRDRAFVLVSHDANVIQRHCESVGVLHAGQLSLFPTVEAGYEFYQATMKAGLTPEEL
jgi:capsular polysaccharide transport system ATP-binding protein